MASFLARALDLPASETDWFTDDDGLSHESNINAVADAGITLGCGTGIYCPADLVPRDQMASFLARALGLDPIIPPPPTTTTTTTAAPTTTTTQPTTTTTTEPPWEEFTVEGSGDDVIDLVVRDDDPVILSITYEGGSNFIVWSYDSSGDRIDLLVNVIGQYSGRVPVNFLVGEEVVELDITTSGSWSITVQQLSSATAFSDSVSGVGDDVVAYLSTSSRITATHDGGSNLWSGRGALTAGTYWSMTSARTMGLSALTPEPS